MVRGSNLGGEEIFLPVQTDPEAHPASCTMGTGPFPGVKRPGRGADHPLPSKCRGHERVGLYLWAFMACYGAPLPFTLLLELASTVYMFWQVL